MTADSPEHAAADGAEHIPMYGPDFTRDPGHVYGRARAHGELAPVELAPGVPATLVVGYDAALEIMRDPGRFPRGSAVWEEEVGPECPVLPILMARPNALATNGPVHARFRSAIVDSLSRVHPAELRRYVENSADALIDAFAGDGGADLIERYTRPLPLLVLADMLGCPREIADRYERGMTGIIEGADPEASLAMLTKAVQDLVALRKADPGRDVTSWMLRHPSALDDDEVANQIGLLFASGTEPLNSLLANGLRLLLSDDRFFGGLSGGTLPVQDALDEVLWTDPPISNCGPTFPRRDVEFRGHRLPAHKPVIIGYTAANTDPSRASGDRTGNRAHLAFGGGTHSCPAKSQSRLIAAVAIERLLDRLPEMELAVPAAELEWRPGPFHRALTGLPVRFPPTADPGRP